MYCLISSLCKICDNDVAGINLRCSGQVCKCPIWTSLNFVDFAKKNSILSVNMVLTLFILLKCVSLENKQTNKANIKYIEDMYS